MGSINGPWACTSFITRFTCICPDTVQSAQPILTVVSVYIIALLTHTTEARYGVISDLKITAKIAEYLYMVSARALVPNSYN